MIILDTCLCFAFDYSLQVRLTINNLGNNDQIYKVSCIVPSISSLIRVLETEVTAHVPPDQSGNMHIDVNMSTHIAIRLPEDNYMTFPVSLDLSILVCTFVCL